MSGRCFHFWDKNRRMYKYHQVSWVTFAYLRHGCWGHLGSPDSLEYERVEGSNFQRFHGLGTNLLTILIWLVVYLLLWKIWKSMGRIIPYIMEHEKCLKPPTSTKILCLSFAVRPIRKRRGWVRRGASTVRTEEQCSGIWNARMSPMYYTLLHYLLIHMGDMHLIHI